MVRKCLLVPLCCAIAMFTLVGCSEQHGSDKMCCATDSSCCAEGKCANAKCGHACCKEGRCQKCATCCKDGKCDCCKGGKCMHACCARDGQHSHGEKTGARSSY